MTDNLSIFIYESKKHSYKIYKKGLVIPKKLSFLCVYGEVDITIDFGSKFMGFDNSLKKLSFMLH